MNQVPDNQNAEMSDHPIHELNRQVNEQPPSPETVKLIDAMVDACAYAGFNDVAKHLRAAFAKEEALKTCGWCGWLPYVKKAEGQRWAKCSNPKCFLSQCTMTFEQWQTRKGER